MGRPLSSEPGLRNPNMLDEAPGGRFLGIYIQGEDIGQSDPRRAIPSTMRRDLTAHVEHGGEGLRPAVIEAFHRLAQAPSPAQKGVPNPKEQGQMASDAG